jgi:hypothetical protein
MERIPLTSSIPIYNQRSHAASTLLFALFDLDLPGEVFVDEGNDVVGHVARATGACAACG